MRVALSTSFLKTLRLAPEVHLTESVKYQPLSIAAEDDEVQTTNIVPVTTRSRSRFLILSIGAFVINLIWSILNLKFSTNQQSLLYTPAHAFNGVRVERWDLSVDKLTEYTKAPGVHADDAWEKISMGGIVGFVQVQKDELDKIGESSVPLADGSGYLVGLENYLRKHLYNGTYRIDPASESVSADDHIPHCIDSIRLALQCQADLSVIPFKWVQDYLEPWPDFRTNHVCRDFKAIRDWAEMNQPNLQGKLVHPQLGVVSSATELNTTALPLHKGHVNFLAETGD